MKNVLKKISAIAMAFALLGTGTTIAKNVNPKSVNTLTASAANDGWYYQTTCNKVTVTHWDGRVETFSYRHMAVYVCNGFKTMKICTPDVPVSIYVYSVQAARFEY